MFQKNEILNEILIEWAYRLDSGMPNPKNREHLWILSEVLSDLGLSEIKNEFIANLLEADKSEEENYHHLGAGVYVRKTDVGTDGKAKEGAQKFKREESGEGKNKQVNFRPLSPQEYEKMKATQGDAGEKAASTSKQNSQADGGGGEETQQTGTSLDPNTTAGKSYIDSLPDEDVAKVKSDDSSKPLTKAEKQEKVNAALERSQQLATEVYGDGFNGPLLQNSKTSDMALQEGYVLGKYWTAMGNATSCFNENMSNEGVKVLENYSDLSEDELTAVLFQKSKGTGLGKQQTSGRVHSPTKKDTGSIPDDLTKEEKELWKSCRVAARSAKSKHKRAVDGAKAAQEQVGFGENYTIQTFGGTGRNSGKKGEDANTPDDVVADLEALQAEIEKAEKVFVYDRGTGKVYEIPKDEMLDWVKSSGGGENAGDTAVINKDENGNLIFDGWSDKYSFSDNQGNSTLNDDYNKQEKNISDLEKLGQIDSQTAASARAIIDKAKKESAQIEADYKKAPKKEAQYFGTLFGKDRERIIQHLKDQEEGYDKAGTTNHVRNAMEHYGVSTHEELLDKLIEESKTGNPSAPRLKVINRVADTERAYIKSSGNEVSPGLDTNKILSDAREQALNLQRDSVNQLNQLKGKTKSGKEKGVGDMLVSKEAIDFLHLDKIENPTDSKSLLKRNTELVMAGVAVTPESIKGCLGVDNLSEFQDNFETVTDDESFTYDKGTGTLVTGKTIYIYAITKEGKRKFVGKKVYRSKEGPTGKTQNTVEWSKDMQECFDSK